MNIVYKMHMYTFVVLGMFCYWHVAQGSSHIPEQDTAIFFLENDLFEGAVDEAYKICEKNGTEGLIDLSIAVRTSSGFYQSETKMSFYLWLWQEVGALISAGDPKQALNPMDLMNAGLRYAGVPTEKFPFIPNNKDYAEWSLARLYK